MDPSARVGSIRNYYKSFGYEIVEVFKNISSKNFILKLRTEYYLMTGHKAQISNSNMSSILKNSHSFDSLFMFRFVEVMFHFFKEDIVNKYKQLKMSW